MIPYTQSKSHRSTDHQEGTAGKKFLSINSTNTGTLLRVFLLFRIPLLGTKIWIQKHVKKVIEMLSAYRLLTALDIKKQGIAFIYDRKPHYN